MFVDVSESSNTARRSLLVAVSGPGPGPVSRLPTWMSSMPEPGNRLQEGMESSDDISPFPVRRLHGRSSSMRRQNEEFGHDEAPQASEAGARQQHRLVTPPRQDASTRHESTSRGPNMNRRSGALGHDPQASEEEESKSTASPNSTEDSSQYSTRLDRLDRLYGRHKVLFTPEEDEALIRSLWHITKAGKYRSSRKWKNVADSGGDALSRRTPLALKDRYRILSIHPKLLDEYPDLQKLIVKMNRMVGYAR